MNAIVRQEAFEKCWAHSPLRAAARRLFYIATHQVSLLSNAACASMSTTTTTRDRGDRYGPIEWAQQDWYLIQTAGATCVSVSRRERANSARSAIDRYCFSANFRSSPSSCWVLNGVRGWRACFCLRSSITAASLTDDDDRVPTRHSPAAAVQYCNNNQHRSTADAQEDDCIELEAQKMGRSLHGRLCLVSSSEFFLNIFCLNIAHIDG